MQNIPKIIHYCWFGGKPLPDEYKKYIDSWKKYCPDWEIREWNLRCARLWALIRPIIHFRMWRAGPAAKR